MNRVIGHFFFFFRLKCCFNSAKVNNFTAASPLLSQIAEWKWLNSSAPQYVCLSRSKRWNLKCVTEKRPSVQRPLRPAGRRNCQPNWPRLNSHSPKLTVADATKGLRRDGCWFSLNGFRYNKSPTLFCSVPICRWFARPCRQGSGRAV